MILIIKKVKNYFLCTIIVLSLGTQSLLANNTSFGLIGGPNFASLSYNNKSSLEQSYNILINDTLRMLGSSINITSNLSPDGYQGYFVGLFYTSFFYTSDVINFYFQGELEYIIKGGKAIFISSQLPTLTGTLEYKYEYLDIPLLLGADIPLVDSLSFRVMGGLSVGIPLSYTIKRYLTVNGWDNTPLSSLKPDVDGKRAINYLIGGGLAYTIKLIEISVQARYSGGLLNIDKDASHRDINVFLSIGYRLIEDI